MKKHYTVKARIHHGSKSLDLTIPSNIVKTHKINPGDIFKIELEKRANGDIEIRYNRVFANK